MNNNGQQHNVVEGKFLIINNEQLISERMTLKIMQFIHATIILQIHLSGFIEDLATD